MTKRVKNILTDGVIRRLEPRDKPYKLTDRHTVGLRILVYKSGRKVFVGRYVDENKKSTERYIGDFPDMSLDEARSAFAKKKLNNKIKVKKDDNVKEKEITTFNELTKILETVQSNKQAIEIINSTLTIMMQANIDQHRMTQYLVFGFIITALLTCAIFVYT